MRKLATLTFVVAAMAITACVNHATDIYNVELSSYNATETLDAKRAEQAIKTAGSKIGWEMDTIRPGLIRGTLNVRKHLAVVDISYDGDRFSIDYVESENLAYDVEKNLIHKSYNNGAMSTPVLRAVNFRVGKGELVAIMGASGSGKTTLMNILGCLDTPHQRLVQIGRRGCLQPRR